MRPRARGRPHPTLSAPSPTSPEGTKQGPQLRDILQLTWPVILSQVLLNAVGLVDVLMLGTLGTQTLAAVGYATQCLFVVQSCMMAVGAACVAMMARAVGNGNLERARTALATNLWVGMVGFALPLMLWAILFPETILHLLAVPQDVLELAVPYFRWTMAASLSLGLCQIYDHAFRAVRNTVTPLRVTVVTSVTKVGLNLLLIFGGMGIPAMGLVGAGYATVLAHTLGAALFLLAARRHGSDALRPRVTDFLHAGERLRETLRLSLPALGERLTMTLALMVYFRFLAHYGVAAIAAYNVGVRILAFTWIPGIGLSVAASTLVGQALGAHDPISARQNGQHAVRLGLIIAIALGVLFVLLRTPMSWMFTDDPEVVAALDPFILILGAALPFLVTHFTLAGALRGAGDTVTPLHAATVGNWVIRVPLGYVFSSVLGLSLAWVWAIMLLDHLCRAVWLVQVFRKGSWDQKLGDEA